MQLQLICHECKYQFERKRKEEKTINRSWNIGPWGCTLYNDPLEWNSSNAKQYKQIQMFVLRNEFKCKPFSWLYGLKSIPRILNWIWFGKCHGYIELNWKWNNWKTFKSFNWKIADCFYFVYVSGESTKWQSGCNANECGWFNEKKLKKRGGKLCSASSDKVSRLLTFCGVFGWQYKIERANGPLLIKDNLRKCLNFICNVKLKQFPAHFVVVSL